VRVREGNDLTGVTGVGDDFLVADSAVLKTNSPVEIPDSAGNQPRTFKRGAVGEDE